MTKELFRAEIVDGYVGTQTDVTSYDDTRALAVAIASLFRDCPEVQYMTLDILTRLKLDSDFRRAFDNNSYNYKLPEL